VFMISSVSPHPRRYVGTQVLMYTRYATAGKG
jgi:hypothetical protein